MSHKFRFSKESKERLNTFNLAEKLRELVGEKPDEKTRTEPEERSEPQTQTVPVAEIPAVEKARDGSVGQEVSKGLVVAARTNIGKVRRTNQDALIDAPEDSLFGVADGMGGHNGGETASAGTRDGLKELLHGKEPELGSLRTAIGAVNRRLYMQQEEDESLSGMGTTLTALWLSKACVYIGHVGDSRAYRLRDGKMEQITDDHSVVAELVRSGMLTKEQAAVHPMRNVITRAVGTEEGIEIDLMCEERRKGDTWLVCSDGLYGMVEDEEIEEILKANEPDEAADKLIEAALNGGGKDNVSLVILLDKEGGA